MKKIGQQILCHFFFQINLGEKKTCRLYRKLEREYASVQALKGTGFLGVILRRQHVV
jgi:hypothetical protein